MCSVAAAAASPTWSNIAAPPGHRACPRHRRVPHAWRQKGRQGGGQPCQDAPEGGGGVLIRLQWVGEIS